jgi:NADH-ubiquinone oxidoreductase chain 5
MVDLLGLITAFFTGFYSGRVLVVLLGISPQSPFILLVLTHEAALFLATSQNFLVVPSILAGYLTNDMFTNSETTFFFQSSIAYMNGRLQHIHDILDPSILLSPICVSIFGLCWSYIYYKYLYIAVLPITLLPSMRMLYTIMNNKWYFDQLYNHYIVRTSLYIADKVTYEILDRGVFEWIGPSGLQCLTRILLRYVLNCIQV